MKIIFPDFPPPRVASGDKLVNVSLKYMLRAQPSKVVDSGRRREHAASLWSQAGWFDPDAIAKQ